MLGGMGIMINADRVTNMMTGKDNNTIPHEAGHTAGLYHPDIPEGKESEKRAEGQFFRPFKGKDSLNIMYSNRHNKPYDGAVNLDDKRSIEVNQQQVSAMVRTIKKFNGKKINIK